MLRPDPEMKSFLLSFSIHSVLVLLLFFSPWVRPILPEKIRPVFLVSLKKPLSPVKIASPKLKTQKGKVLNKKLPLVKEEKGIEIILGKRIEERLKQTEGKVQSSKFKIQNLESKEEATKEKVFSQKAATVISEAGFAFSWYLTLLQKRITEAWRPPAGSLCASKESILSFSLTRNGKVKNILIKKSSDIPGFDRSALKVIEDITDLPPLPSNWKKEELRVIVTFKAI